ncbi:DUF418 domain-containing protein [Hyphomonas sp. WL0036]|uniref:DUF418 domain-containing protein n=1 Tax=Hyphomonas sediminis TaxID=2866160 RepID=UPI001C7FB1CB|nr:DUF418 domain-containing protein [Hyphomonas sediminis]MBY9067649.1 DUF418 domain-containing protein [Hyphomonas sediminis]
MPHPTERSLTADLVRAFALIGIAVVNVFGFAFPASEVFQGSALETQSDKTAYLTVASLFLMKSYPLFSMIFGAGLLWQVQAAAAQGASPAGRYYRRMLFLICLGLLHFTYLWHGDILMIYGALGCLLFLIRGLSSAALAALGTALIGLNVMILLLLGVLLGAADLGDVAESLASRDALQATAFTTGSFFDAASWRLSQLPSVLPSVLLQQGISVFGFFCLGIALAKLDVFDQPSAKIWKISRRFLLPIGLAGSIWAATLLMSAPGMVSSRFLFGSALLMAFSPLSALGYAGLISLLARRRAGATTHFLARAGSASLTAYLLQSVIFSALYSGYGAGLFGNMSTSEAFLTAILVGMFSLGFCGVWRAHLAYGPMEILLRRVTYWNRA